MHAHMHAPRSSFRQRGPTNAAPFSSSCFCSRTPSCSFRLRSPATPKTVAHGLLHQHAQAQSWTGPTQPQQPQQQLPHLAPTLRSRSRPVQHQHRASAAGSSSGGTNDQSSSSGASSTGGPPPAEEVQGEYDLRATKAMVETAMLAAVSGLGYLLATTVKLENSIGYFLPLPVVIAAMRSGKRAGLDTALASLCLLLVMVGPLKAVAYFLLHGIVASTLGALWRARVPWAVSVPLGAFARMTGQAAYLCLSSFTMNENLLAVVLANVHSFLDQMSANMGMSGAPSPMTVASILFAMFLVNSLCYVFLIHVIYRMALQSMGFQLGPLPKLVQRYLYGGTVRPDEPPSNYQRSISATN